MDFRNIDVKKWAMIGGAAALTCAVISASYALYKRSNSQGPTAAATSPSGDPSGDLSGSTSKTLKVREQNLIKELASCVETLSQEKSITNRQEELILKKLQRIAPDIHELSAASRVLISQYGLLMFQYHIKSMGKSSNKTLVKEQFSALRQSYADTYLVSSWHLLETLTSKPPKDLAQESDLISRLYNTQLDVAFMLQDMDKINAVYEKAVSSLMSRLDSAPRNDVLLALVTASSCGKIFAVSKLGSHLKGGELDGVHNGALQDPSRVDFSALYTLALQLQDNLDTQWKSIGKDLEWSAFRIVKARFRAIDPRSTDAAILRPNLSATKFVEYDPQPDSHFLRSGAVTHFVNPGPVAIPMSGFASKEEAILFGYFDITAGKEIIRVTNCVTLKRDKSGGSLVKWTGKELSSMVAIAGPRAGNKLSTTVLDAEFVLEEDPSGLYKCL